MAGIWSASVGPHGARVWVAERKIGRTVALHYRHPGRGRVRRSLGFRVRDAEGKLIPGAVSKAKQKAFRAYWQDRDGLIVPYLSRL